MANSRDRRIAKELQDLYHDKDKSGVSAVPVDGITLTHLRGWFPGPGNTPYADGRYEIDIKIPTEYPFKSPTMKFLTKIWHPNVSSQTGAICLDTLSNNWSPVQTIKTTLLSVRMLLENPNPRDPQDAEVAKMLMDDPKGYAHLAHEWAVRFAGAPRQARLDMSRLQREARKVAPCADESQYMGYNKQLVDQFVNMGFELDAVIEAFTYFGIDHNDGEDYVLEEAYVGDITARLLGEQ